MLISIAPRVLLRALMVAVVFAIMGTAFSGPSAASEPTGGISGTVTWPGGAMHSEAEPFVSVMTQDGTPVAQATVSSSGSYAVTGLDAGTYIAQFGEGSDIYASTFFGGSSIQDATGITVGIGTGPAIEFAAVYTASILGRVSDSRGVALRSPRQLWVDLLDEAGDIVKTLPVKTDGTFGLWGLTAGSYRVRIQDWAHSYLSEYYGETPTLAGATVVDVVAGTATSGIDVSLDLSVVASGRFVGPGGGPLDPSSWIMVRAYDESGAQVGQAQSSLDDATFELSEIPGGRYRLAFTDIGCGYKTSYYNSSDNFVESSGVDVLRGQILNLGDIELSPSSGCAPDGVDGKPVVGVGGSSLTVSWDGAVAEGSPAVTGYFVSSLPAGAGCATAGVTSCVVTGAAPGVEYRFFASATNGDGTSLPSPPSEVVRAPVVDPVTVPAREAVTKNQRVAKVPTSLRKGKSKPLPSRTDARTKVRWTSTTPRVCIVRGGKVIARKAGKCRLRAVAQAHDEWLRFESTRTIRVR
ncbi:MAG: fibronectin type III domain-containing protein [Candidatus Nanopelagicales bacterium]